MHDELAAYFRVLALDWPGFGNSKPANLSHIGAAAYAEVLREVVDALGVQRAAFIGNSVGGLAAALLAASNPDMVSAIVLANPAGFTPHNAATRAFCRFKGTVAGARLTTYPMARSYLRRRTPVVQAMIHRARAHIRDRDELAVNAAIWRSFLEPSADIRRVSPSIKAPTLLVWGRLDPVLPLRRDGRVARTHLLHATFVELNTGHAPFAEDPEQFLATTLPFLRGHD